ncbi:JmjC-domain-containing protein [Roridomyces roridus]|uniref:JmjC-domain-containing protein n=1 Tax=Roridomyces roridus TaxID=1738132 RepID=A0AAD7C7P4_9AGAR|nr:JmjC-domain-containing protein [Roridomyces roridus]
MAGPGSGPCILSSTSMASPVSSLTASRSPSPEPPVQPDHFYGADPAHLPSPNSEGKCYLSPDDDPLAHRGIPVFKPSMQEFADFEEYMTRVEAWGRRSGIIKVIPPKEWTEALPDFKPQLADVKIKSPIEQFMRGRAGLFRQENMEKRKLMSVREWAELCSKDEFRAPGKDQVGVHNNPNAQPATRRRRKTKTKEETQEPEVKVEEDTKPSSMASPPNSASPDPEDTKPDDNKPRNRRVERADKDAAFIEGFSPHTDWLPSDTKASDYTPEFCAKLERAYWRNCGLGKPAWYGADTMGSLYTSDTTAWNVAHLTSALSRLLPASSQGLPGVNTPYLYFGMWRATFAWHVEDMDLFSINYIHFGAPKFWYAVPQARAGALEDTMRGYFPKDTSTCPQFLRHKSFLASPTLLAQSAVRPNHLVQHAGEFVITYPRGYHAGFNLGFNCAESVNFALDSWLDEGRKAAVCKCVDDSVRIDVDQLLEDRRIEVLEKTDPAAAAAARAARDGVDYINNDDVPVEDAPNEPLPTLILPPAKPRSPRKRKPTAPFDPDAAPAAKRPRTASASDPSASTSAPRRPPPMYASNSALVPPPKVTLKLGPRPADEVFPCCLCVSPSHEGLARVHDLPLAWREVGSAAQMHFPANMGGAGVWMAHEACARVLPETWVDEIDGERVVFGVDGIVRGRWSLKCNSCAHARAKGHGALIQCTKGKCPKAYHISCAVAGEDIGYSVLREVEKEVVLVDPGPVPNSVEESNLRVIKVIKKTEVELLCPQHNPAVIASRRASKADVLRAELLALPPLARIKIRASSGVFEVTLIRVVEERRSVEVLWGATEVREVKWANIVFPTTGAGAGLPSDRPPPALAPYHHVPHQQTQYPPIATGLSHHANLAGPGVPMSSSMNLPTNPTPPPVPPIPKQTNPNPYAALVGAAPGSYGGYPYDNWAGTSNGPSQSQYGNHYPTQTWSSQYYRSGAGSQVAAQVPQSQTHSAHYSTSAASAPESMHIDPQLSSS